MKIKIRSLMIAAAAAMLFNAAPVFAMSDECAEAKAIFEQALNDFKVGLKDLLAERRAEFNALRKALRAGEITPEEFEQAALELTLAFEAAKDLLEAEKDAAEAVKDLLCEEEDDDDEL